jgi:hypothetical protein
VRAFQKICLCFMPGGFLGTAYFTGCWERCVVESFQEKTSFKF